MEKLPVLTWTDINGRKHEIDPQTWISQKLRGSYHKTSGRPTSAEGAAITLSQSLFPADLFPNSPNNIWSDPDKVDYSKFENPEDAKRVLPAIKSVADEMVGDFYALNSLKKTGTIQGQFEKRFNEIASKAGINSDDIKKAAEQRQADITSGKLDGMGRDNRIEDAKNMPYTTWAKKYGTNYSEWDNLRSQDVSTTPNLSSQAKSLVDRALKNDQTTNLTQQSWWNSQPKEVRDEAFATLQEITGSAQGMADYVKSEGLTDLQNYSWWNSSPYKQQAWDMIEKKTGTTTGADTTTGAMPGTEDKLSNALNIIDSDKTLTADEKSLFKSVVRNWDLGKELNMQNVLSEFNKIKTETIDPEFKAQTDFFINQLQEDIKFQEAERARQLEQERSISGENIRQAKAGLEKAGMTFTGKGIETLGKDSAYAQQGTESGVPDQTPFGGMFYEGNVNQANRLMASSSLARYRKNLQTLGTQAEKTLGSQGLSGLNIPGYGMTGGLTGSLPIKKQQVAADTLSALAGQQRQNISYQQPIQFKTQ